MAFILFNIPLRISYLIQEIKNSTPFTVLPELPIPGPAAHANSEPGSALLYHRSLVDEASQLLATPANEELMAKLSAALSTTSGKRLEDQLSV